MNSDVEAVVFGFTISPIVKLKDSNTAISSMSLSSSNSRVTVLSLTDTSPSTEVIREVEVEYEALSS